MKHTVLLLGATGMLGSMLLDVLSQEPSITLSATVRDKEELKKLEKEYPFVTFFVFNAEKDSFSELLKKIKSVRWIVNAIGVIKPFIHDDNEDEVRRAYQINSVFPSTIEKVIRSTSVNVIQIATDCVYSGKKGEYIETDWHDALDVYGKTKSLGEVVSPNIIHLRVSIIGPENATQKSLLEWFLHQRKNASVAGITNHKWNGVTTFHFARISLGLIVHDIKISGVQHIVPKDQISKEKLLELFVKKFHREDVQIIKTKANETINRTLSTLHDKMNKQLWDLAGYKNPPTIEQMLEELAEYMKKRNITVLT